MAGKIFINYRRGDDPGNTGRLFDRLQDVFEPQQLFLDVDNIAPGLDFVRELNDRVAECDIVLAVIGRGWVDARNAEGARRLDDPDDFVRIEIESALNQGKRVIPVLVGEGQLPKPEDLPETLQPLTRRNAVRLTHERFRADVAGLVKALQHSLEEIEARREAEAEARRRAQAEEERKRQEAEAARRAEEEALRKKAELEAQEHAAAERRRQDAEAKIRAGEEQAFGVAKVAGTVVAFDAFLALHPASSFVDETRQLKAALQAREEAHHRTLASDDPAALRSFLATYNKGADVDQVRGRLRTLEQERAVAERRRQEAETKLRAEEERAFGVAKRAGTVIALDAFLAVHPAGAFADEARKLQPALLARAEAYARTSASDDPAALRSFLATYSKGADVVEVRKRLRRLEAPAKQAAGPQPAMFIAAAVAVVVVAGAVLYWVARPASPPSPAQAAATASAINAPPVPSPDVVTWSLLRDTTDDAALKRFIEQYPDSPLRKAAAARVAMLAADAAAKAQAAAKAEAEKADAEAKTEAALKAQAAQEADAAAKAAAAKAEADADAKIAAANKAFDDERAKLAAQASVGQQAALTTPADAGQAASLSGSALIQQIKMELMRVGCYNGALDGNWTSPDVKLSIAKFVKDVSLTQMPDQPTADFLKSIRGQSSRVCPLECAKTQTVSNGQCVAKTCPSGQSLDSDGDCVTPKERTASRPAPAAAAPAAAVPSAGAAAGGIGVICNKTGCHNHTLVTAPAGLPCKAAFQRRDGSWQCG